VRYLLANIIKNTGFEETKVIYRRTIQTCYCLVYHECLRYGLSRMP